MQAMLPTTQRVVTTTTTTTRRPAPATSCSASSSIGRHAAHHHHQLPRFADLASPRGPRTNRASTLEEASIADPPSSKPIEATAPSSTSSSKPVWDVQGAVVSPAFRATPWAAEKAASAKTLRKKARILFVGESNICRSVLALSITNQLLAEYGLQESVECEAKGTRNYVLGQGPEPSTAAVAAQLGWSLPQGENAVARLFEEDEDIVNFDLILVLDKFTAADVLREVSGFDLINPNGFYSIKVRLLGEFHPTLRSDPRPGAQDIDDPLYGNVGGAEELEAVRSAASTIEESCRGLLTWLKELHEGMKEEDAAAAAAGGAGDAGGNFAFRLKTRVRSMKQIEWLVPPMLQPRT